MAISWGTSHKKLAQKVRLQRLGVVTNEEKYTTVVHKVP
jgi:hypothetical protein